ncbi:MAG: DUF3488 and transglutaminase-like domain-containing protein [Pseudomonadota bacterium]
MPIAAALLALATLATGLWTQTPTAASVAVAACALAALALRRRAAPRWAAPAVALTAVALILVAASWRDPGVLSAGLLIAGWTKLAEARSPRDDLLVALAGLWPLTLAALAAPPGLGAGFLALGGVLVLRLLAGPSARLSAILRAVALALPVAGVLFVFTPRITGDLNILAFALGIPLVIETADERARTPLEDGLALGELSSRADADGRVLVAKFYGGAGNIHDGVPPLGDLYWRGPALYHLEDGVWSGRPGWGSRTARMRSKLSRDAMKADMRETGKLSAYDVRVFPHRGHALYALDLPAAVPPSSFITRDYQLQNLNPVREILIYPMYSYLDYRAGRTLDAETRALALQWTEGENPRTLAAGRALRREARTDLAVARAVRDRFETGYRYDKRAGGDEAPDAVDAFLFDRRAGYASHYASAAVMLLRAADVPARLVLGYRGGVNLGLTQMVYVMEADAYAWAEAWLEEHGWVRIDVAARLSRSDGEMDGWGLAGGLQQAAAQHDDDDEEVEADDAPLDADDGAPAASRRELASARFSDEAQAGLLELLGLRPDWSRLLMLGGVSLAGLAAAALAWGRALRWLGERRLPPAQREARRLQRRFAGLGARRGRSEGWRTFLARVEAGGGPSAELAREVGPGLRRRLFGPPAATSGEAMPSIFNG